MGDISILQVLALSCAAISALLALLFIVLGVIRIIQIWRVIRDAKGETSMTEGLDAKKQGAIADELHKVLEAAAKLTDSLSKAPLAVVSIVMALLFMLLAVWSAYLGREPAKPEAAATLMAGDRCTVGGFASGDHLLPRNAILDEPAGCLNELARRLGTDTLGTLFVVGRCDIQELRPGARARYTENLSLAYQRGISVRDFLAGNLTSDRVKQFDRRLLVMVGGATQSRPEDLAKDRRVELIPFWIVEAKISGPRLEKHAGGR